MRCVPDMSCFLAFGPTSALMLRRGRRCVSFDEAASRRGEGGETATHTVRQRKAGPDAPWNERETSSSCSASSSVQVAQRQEGT